MKTILRYLRYIIKSVSVWLVCLICISFSNTGAQISSFEIQFEYKCAPTVVTFINNSTKGAGIEYLWDFGKGALIPSDEEVLYEAYTQSGSYTVTLAVIDGPDTAFSSQDIFIAMGPQASFTADPSAGCAPHTVTFTDNSIPGDGAINNVFWDFRGGQTRTGSVVNYTYTEAGSKDIFMQVTDENGCSSHTEIPDLITIHPAPTVDFVASDSFSCTAPFAVNFLNLSNGNGELQSVWNYGNGTTSAGFTGTTLYTGNGSYSVMLTVTDENNCTNTLVKDSYINIGTQGGDIFAIVDDQPVFNPGITLCQGTLRFGSTVPSESGFVWEVSYNGDDQEYTNVDTLVINAPDSGIIAITLYYGEGTACPDSISKSFRIDYVKASFEMDKDYACSLPQYILLQNTSENFTEISWYLPDGSGSDTDTVSTIIQMEPTYEIIYNHKVNYLTFPFMLVATNENNCVDTLIREVEVLLPVARIMPDIASGCVPFDVVFSDSSESVEQIVQWDFIIGDDVISQSDNVPVNYTFDEPGIYDVQLIITNESECTDTSYTVQIRAGEKFDPEFSVDPAAICFGGTITLQSDVPPAGAVDSWHYSSPGIFSTGTLTTPNTTVQVYPSSGGPKDVYLTIESNFCAGDTVLEDAFTVDSPTGYFDFEFSCDSPMVYTFVSHFTNADSLRWTIGTDVITNTDTVRYVFSTTGDYPVTLTAFNSATSCSVSKTRVVKIRNVQAAFSVKPVLCVGEEAEFNSSASIDFIDECFIEGFLWDFGDETPPRRNYNTIHNYTYIQEGTYFPKLVVTGDNACTDTLETLVSVILPSADFSVDPGSGCGPDLLVDFNYDSLDETITSWIWLFGDATIDESNNSSPSHSYLSSSDENFIATLVATDFNGCQNYSQQIIQLSVPNAGFQAADPGLCLGEEALFIPADAGLDSYLWDYGDGSTPGISTVHMYNETGTYTVSLTVEKDGCSFTRLNTDYITVEQADATYTLSDSIADCYPALISFSHVGSSSPIAIGTWTYQTGVQSVSYDPVTEFTYSEPGNYFTSLFIQTINNCTASKSKTIEVNGPVVDFIYSPFTICSGDTVSFSITQSDELDEFEWIFGDGNVSDELSPTHVYVGNGTIFPALRVVQEDCEVTLTNNQALRIIDPVPEFTVQNESNNLCHGVPLNVINESSEYDQSIWSIDGSVVSESTHLTDYYIDEPGEYSLTLEIHSDFGCYDSTSQTIHIVTLPEFNISGDNTICPGTEFAELRVEEQPGWSISWQPQEYLNDANSFTPLAQPTESTTFLATVIDENFCTDSQSITVYVDEPPVIERFPVSDTSIIIGDHLQLFVNSENENSSYSWSPLHAVSCRTCQNPVVSPVEDFTYTVVVKDECFESKFQFNVEVIVDFYLELPQAFTPNGDGENDIFYIEANNVAEVDFKIFNRWGNLVFSTEDINDGWDGRHNGKLQNPDTFSYYVRAVSDHGYEFERKGTFLLLR